MFTGGEGDVRSRRLPLVIEQGIDVLARERIGGPTIELAGPRRRWGGVMPLDGTEVVRDEAAPDDQHTFVAQWTQ